MSGFELLERCSSSLVLSAVDSDHMVSSPNFTGLLPGVNPLRHTIEADSAGPAMSAPSTANARLQVTGSSCHLAGSLPASRQCSDRPGFDGLDFAGHGFLMTDDVAEELLVSAEVIAGFRFTRV